MTIPTKNKLLPKNELAALIKSAVEKTDSALGVIAAVANQKGGVGKTTTTYCFAHYLNELGYRVLAVDLDGQGNLTSRFFAADVLERYTHSPARVLFEESGALMFDPLPSPSGIDLLPTPRACHDTTFIDSVGSEVVSHFYNNIKSVAANYDFVLIDTPPSPGNRSTAAIIAANYVFAPVNLGFDTIASLQSVMESMASLSAVMETEIELAGVLVNQVAVDGTNSSVEMIDEVRQAVGNLMLESTIRVSSPFRRAIKQGVPPWHARKTGAERVTQQETEKAYGELALRIKEVDPRRVACFNEISREIRAIAKASV